MKQLYRRTFEHVRMSEERSQALRSALASRCAMNELEVRNMNNPKKLHRPAALVIALLAILALTTTAFAAGGYVVYRIHANDDLPVNGDAQLIDFEPDAVLPYENFTEADGEVTFTFDPEDWTQAK